ncbi:5'-nucleotidase C-terminal domain-containing protein [Microbacter margulisiae]|uniref:2',3'-cyclic-nucleotide 2'-phosphodiesterase (5'-nucleotidase family) n=1 Tax=Microbacter margulisiae TaxID=1350067 RepID=A0A7W5DNG2_9PORP|nr:5'-nucleotidase [Microbacter margulisiae]MBB3186162.1 2',3'-cyclic-nucleotide 2'-phosphodiesterase (5'-nucleotidase family) [Microbacter margulisiae]
MRQAFIFLWILLLATSCSSYKVASITATHIPVDQRADGIQDQRMVALIKPYVDSAAKVANAVIGYSDETMRVERPEGLLSNFFADVMLSYSRQHYPGDSVAIAVTNIGGFRNPIYKGPITVGKIYELMPFQNELVVLYLKGNIVQQLADSIAKYGGAVAGIRFGINSQKSATHIMVQGVPLNPDKIYAVAANDYIAKGNDHFDALTQAAKSITYPISLRRLMIDYIKQQTIEGHPIHQTLDGRIYEDQ